MIASLSLVVILIPWSPLVPADQIWMGEHLPPIQSERLALPGGQVRISVSAPDWIRLKRRAEGLGGYCQTAASVAAESAQSECQLTLDAALERERLTIANDKATIEALKAQLLSSQVELLEARELNHSLRWVSIVGGVAALGLTVGLVLK